jgi:formamidopyrimidine-DNA glycosylase
MGPEPLSETFTGEGLKYGARSKQGTAIKTVLLDQSVVAGVGNIYGDEALFRSGISPLRKAGSLTDAEWRILAENIKMVIGDAVSAGGTLSNNYVDVYGLVGRYRPQVYGRANEPCIDCGVQLKGSRLAGRSTVFCPNCQQ